jgi:flagellar basal body L-ring protein FlgH
MTVEFDATHNLYTNVVASNSNDVLTVKIKIGKSLGNE